MSGTLEGEDTQLLQFLYACPIGLAEIAVDGEIAMINPFAMQLLLPLARTPWMTNFFTLMEAYAPELRNMVDTFLPAQGTVCENHRVFISSGTKEGGYEPKVLSCTLVKLTSQRFITTIANVSYEVAQEFRLKQAETWFASLLDGVNNFAVISLDAEGRIDKVNPSVLRQTGFNESETMGHTLDIFDVPGTAASILSMAEQIALARRDGWHLNEGWQNRRGGNPYWCQRLIAARSEHEVRDGWAISGYTVILREVARQSFDAGKLTRMLTTDHLTGACNRSHFFEIAERAYLHSERYGQPLALIAIDVDHFKHVNDTHGHGGGDEVLKLFSRACMSLLRPSDTFARIGGEEFVVLLPSTDLQGAAQLAERLRATIATTTIEVAGGALHITASFGCASTDARPGTFTVLLAAADKALYAAKQSGRDCVNLSSPPWAVI